MKVVLLENVRKLGDAGEDVTVKDGYARNYLFPKKLAAPATDGVLKILEARKKQREKKEKELIENFRELAGKIKDLSPTISMEAGEGDKLFGTVTSEMIVECLGREGVEIDKKQIVIKEPIKALGMYSVEVKLHREVTAQLRIWVVKK